jgi:serine phosphatase RsbU (regulator of sigma subunit)
MKEKKMEIKRFRLALAIYAAFQAPALLSAETIDLNAREFFVRPGFETAWTREEPSQADPAWTQVPARIGSRPLVARDLGLTPYMRGFLGSLSRREPAEFCFVTSFEASKELVDSAGGLGLFLERVGQGWEVYLNGVLMRSEFPRDLRGALAADRSTRGALIDLDKRALRAGSNILALRIAGDPGSGLTGLPAGGPYLVGPNRELLARGSERLDFVLIGVYAFFGLYHVFLFAMRPRNKPYLAFGFGSLVLAAYILARSYAASGLVASGAALRSVELACLFLLFPIFTAFFDLMARGSVSRLALAYGAASLAAALTSAFALQEALLRLWMLSLPLPLAFVLAADLAKPLAAAWRSAREGPGEGAAAKPGILGSFLGRNDQAKLLLGAILLFAAVGLDLVRYLGGLEPAFAKYAFLFLAFGAAWVLAGQYHRVYEKVEDMAATLESKVAERTAELESAMSEQSGLNLRLRESNLRLQNAMDIQAKDMRMAVQVQQGMFPAKAPEIPGWELAFCFLPAAGVSGDFYDFYVEEDVLEGLVVGDVSGHGIASGLVTILARSVFWRCFRDLAPHSLGRVLEEVNAEMSQELSSVENYLTCILLRLREGGVEYANAAHTELAYRRAGKAKANFLVPKPVDDYKGPPLGREGIEAPYRAVKFAMDGGDSLFAYTDGLLEARDDSGKSFGAENLLTSYGRAPEGSAQDMLDYVMDDWRYHVGSVPLADDLTAVLLKRKN